MLSEIKTRYSQSLKRSETFLKSKKTTPKTSSITSTRELCLLRNQAECPICAIKFSGKNHNTEHIHPRALGGLNVEENKIQMCTACNNSRNLTMQSMLGTHPYYKNYPKISGVITDILYDHLLCIEWEKHTNEKLSLFIKKSYDYLDTRIHQMPPRMIPIYSHMRANDWFSRYQTIEGTELSLMQIGKRMGFGSAVGDAVMEFKRNETMFIDEFNVFFYEMSNFSKGFLAKY